MAGASKLKRASRSRSKEEILKKEPRCIYCPKPHNSVEHMPPISMFTGRDRPSGLEFATCEDCNNGTNGADVVAAAFARMRRMPERSDPLLREALEFRNSIQKDAPGVWEEFTDPARNRQVLVPSSGGIYRLAIEITADGPQLRGHLDVFSAKLGMALYREHTGHALPLDGMVTTSWFLNQALSQKHADAMLKMLPGYDGLRQGQKTSEGQFAYRYNSDGKTTVAALSQFHQGLYIFTAATCMPELYRILSMWPKSALSKPGDLVKMLPQRPRRLPLLG